MENRFQERGDRSNEWLDCFADCYGRWMERWSEIVEIVSSGERSDEIAEQIKWLMA